MTLEEFLENEVVGFDIDSTTIYLQLDRDKHEKYILSWLYKKFFTETEKTNEAPNRN